ncbi:MULTISPECIES: DUF1254 domain-containing protein [unclassified Cupriavidus]|uniref:DUF1254 domain-containing protein n=1 Tax=unclassified Cupriavidus TaxID=2640874 RepID=UPI0010F5A691|nr:MULTISPECIES: DUF1214 domain-containing protein [unclassified Cupriavidus]MWL89590.1 DUF1214 domain-containing protein [Cupriavidus sp. SW-Y-13]
MDRRQFLVSTAGGALAATTGAPADAQPAGAAPAQGSREPLGGQPPPGSAPSVKDFDYQIKYHRAFEAVLWNMPAIAIFAFRRAAFADLGMQDNDIIAYSAPATPRLEAITANSSTPYIAAYTDLRKGPVVLEVPKAGPDGSVYGQVVDAWQFTIADVGPSGMDKGKGGKYLFTPPGYKDPIPKGHIHVASPNYRIALAFRSVRAPGKSVEDAYHYAQRLRMYYLSEAASPPRQRFVDPANQRYPTLPFYDERHFADMHEILSVEPVKEQDKVMMGMLKSLGIEKGKPFTPDDTAKRAMRQAAIDAWFFLQQWFDTEMVKRVYWPDRHYVSLLQTDANRRFTFTYDDRIDLIERAAEYFWCTYMPKELGVAPATHYMVALADKDGKRLEPGKLYKVDVPRDMPVKQFWALTVYDHATFAFIYSDSNRTTLSSYDLDKMRKNPDGSVTIYVGPRAPGGLESNWLPSEGKRPMPTMRFYGATDAMNNKTFKMPDFELVGT